MNNIRNILRDFTPPVLWRNASRSKHLGERKKEIRGEKVDSIFKGESDIFVNALKNTKVYGEYGVGQSTVWVRNNTNVRMICVDSDPSWIKMVQAKVDRTDDIDLIHVDLGPLAEWGRPRGYGNRDNFTNYPKALWNNGTSPDTVLIDGRFRVSCFLYSVRQGAAGTRIIFDDYVGRDEYYIVEEILEPTDINKRQALFVIPEKSVIDMQKVEHLINSFRLVTE